MKSLNSGEQPRECILFKAGIIHLFFFLVPKSIHPSNSPTGTTKIPFAFKSLIKAIAVG